MKSAIGAGGLISTVAATGKTALAGLGVLTLLLIAVLCWTVANQTRTANLVAILTALRPTTTRPVTGYAMHHRVDNDAG